MAFSIPLDSSSASLRKYDVFLNFSGVDTRRSFVSHLYATLHRKRVRAFMDDRQLERGGNIFPNLLQAIGDSRISIIIFSKYYAYSSCCLYEIETIFERMRQGTLTAIPVFFGVDPKEVQELTGEYGRAFTEHANDFSPDQVSKWRVAITKIANLAGWDLQNSRNEAEFIEAIVDGIVDGKFLKEEEGVIGIDNHDHFPSGLRIMTKKKETGMPVFAKQLIALGVAGGIAKSAVAPLERVKILFQTRRDEFKANRLLGSIRKILNTEGIKGFYRGNGASVARIVPYAALHCMAYEEYRRQIILAFPNVIWGPILDLVAGPTIDLVAGSFAGGTAVLFTYPLDLVRTKLAYQVVGAQNKIHGLVGSEQVYRGIGDCFRKTFKESGVRGLYRGVGPSLYGFFLNAGLKFYFYEEIKRHVPQEHRKDIMVKLGCGSVAGLLGETFTYPLDVVRRQMQVQRLSATNGAEMRGTMDTLAMIVKNQGLKQLFSGLSINYLKVVPSMAIGFTIYDIMKSNLIVPSRPIWGRFGSGYRLEKYPPLSSLV